MKKLYKRILFCACLSGLIWCGGLVSQREQLNENLIRLHVVADSDSPEAQTIKLEVRDAVIATLSDAMQSIADIDEAKAYIRENLPKIEAAANAVLEKAGCGENAIATFAEEVFDTRFYDTFSLPAGVYEALRITIGDGEGKNWWCVVFPTLCVPATSEGFADVAAGAGFPDTLTAALEGEQGYELRFYLLDLLGRLEAKFFPG